MIKAFAPRDSGGCSWVLLSIVLVTGFPVVVWSQSKPAKTKDASAPTEKRAPNAEGNPPVQPAEVTTPENPAAKVETFRDERAEKLLANTFPTHGKPTKREDLKAVKDMAGGAVAVDRLTIERYVQHWMADLTNRGN